MQDMQKLKLEPINESHDIDFRIRSHYERLFGGISFSSKRKFLFSNLFLIVTSLASLVFWNLPPVSQTAFIDNNMVFAIVFSIATIISGSFVFMSARDMYRHYLIKNDKPVPNWLLSKEDQFAIKVALLINNVNKLIGRWDRYLNMVEAEYCQRMIDESKTHTHLLQLIEETKRHALAADTFIHMSKEGDFDEVDPQDMISLHLERVRETESNIRRQLNGVTHHINSPLQAEANVASLNRDLHKGITQGMQTPSIDKKHAGKAKTAGAVRS